MRIFVFIFILFLSFSFFACTSERNATSNESFIAKETLALKYAKQFTIRYSDTGKTITIRQPWSGSKRQFTYQLTGKAGITGTIQTPVNRVVCLSPTPLAMLNLLKLTDKVVAVGSKTDMYNNAFYKKFKAVKTGAETNATQSIESLIELSPDLIVEAATGSAYDNFEKLEELHLKTALFSAHTEPHPLGRTEWIKYLAAFFDREKEAATIFDSIELRYLAIRKKATAQANKPKVFVGYPWKDSWIIPGGNSYMARLIADAGGTYAWAADTSSGNLYVNVEKVLELLPECAIWLHPGVAVLTASDLDQLPVITKTSFGKLKVYNNNKRLNEFGKNDFWESGIVSPDVILMDLVKLFHPAVLKEQGLYYYRVIKE
jgi:iron complex transport system substrate-binding protein